jgi:hypothetical protein
MRAMVRQHANQETADAADAFVKDSTELDNRINEHLQQLRDLMIECQGHEWAKKTVSRTLESGKAEYDLPIDFDEMMGVRLARGDSQVHLDPWDYDQLAYLESIIPAYIEAYRYRVIGDDIVIKPTPTTADTLYMDFIPGYVEITTDPESKSYPMPWGAWRWAALGAAIDLLNKERDAKAIQLLLQSKAMMEARLRKKVARRDRRAPEIRRTAHGVANLLGRRYPRMYRD